MYHCMERKEAAMAYTLITGASGGIGAVLAEEFARHGHDVVLVARSESKLIDLAKNLKARYGVNG